MNDKERLFQFTDNSLNDSEEAALFKSLSENAQLRQSFKSHLKIKSVAPRIYQSSAPTAASTSALFGKLGLDYAAPSLAEATASPAVAGKVSAAPYFWEACIAAGFAVIATIALFLFSEPVNENTVPDLSENIETIAPVRVKSKSEATSNDDIPVSSSSSIMDEQTNSASKEINLLKNENARLRSELLKDSEIIAEAGKTIDFLENKIVELKDSQTTDETTKQNHVSNISPSTIYISQWDGVSDYTSNANTLQSQAVYDSPSYSLDSENRLNKNSSLFNLDLGPDLAIEYRNFHYWTIGNTKLSPKADPAFSNEGIALTANVYGQTDVILDFRREFFNLQFSGTENERLYNYETFPSTESIALGVRQRLALSSELDLYGELTGGFSGLGPLGRAGTGLRFSPLPYLSITAGLEYSYLGFDYQGQMFNSQKTGMFYGISLNL